MRKYDIFSKDNEHEYVVTVEKAKTGTTYSLYASDSDIWTSLVRGKMLLQLRNTGNGITFKSPIKKTLDYPDTDHLRILLHIEEVDSQEKYRPRFWTMSRKMRIKL